MCFLCPIRKRIEEIAKELGVLLAESPLRSVDIQHLIDGEMIALGLVATKTAVKRSAEITLKRPDIPEHEKVKVRAMLQTLETVDAITDVAKDDHEIAAYSPVKGDKQLN